MKNTSGMYFYKLIWILFLINITNHAFAAKKCIMTGDWLTLYSAIKTEFLQTGSSISNINPIIHPQCGMILIEGTIDNNHVKLKWRMTNDKESYCQTWMELSGEINPDHCSILQGGMITHIKTEDVWSENSMPFIMYREMMVINAPDPAKELIISSEPKMPAFDASAMFIRPDIYTDLTGQKITQAGKALYKWKIEMDNSAHRWNFYADLDEASTSVPFYTPNFNLLYHSKKQEYVEGGVLGGVLTLKVTYNDAISDEKKYQIKGTNPGREAIDRVLYNPILRKIACWESRYRQFEANREGGMGLPSVSIGEGTKEFHEGAVGLMQIISPAPYIQDLWNWRKNIEHGEEIYMLKRADALMWPKAMLRKVNHDREAMKLPLCKSLPAFTEEQIQRETLRRYNGGTEYSFYPVDDPDCHGEWIIDPNVTSGGNSKYVDRVLSCEL